MYKVLDFFFFFWTNKLHRSNYSPPHPERVLNSVCFVRDPKESIDIYSEIQQIIGYTRNLF